MQGRQSRTWSDREKIGFAQGRIREKGNFMFRKSALALAMLGAFASTHVGALGLGEIELNSSLNQPLDAELELLSATDADLQGLKVQIGSAEAFSKAGIDRPFFLNKLNFEVKRKADGTAVVRVTSSDVVREPFLDFLLELSWSKGRLLREYTVLVDPPVTMPAPAPVTQAPLAAVPRSLAPSRRVGHAAELPRTSVLPGEYGPTRRNDTLWGIALQVRPDTDVSVEQTMQGLLRANPEAFIANNINNLKAGYILRVPTRDELTSVSRAVAASESRAQYSAWRAARAPVAADDAFSETGLSAELADTPAGMDASAASSLQLVSTDEAGGSGVGEGSSAELQRELIMANEALEEERRQSEEKTSRLSMLEEQVINMQRLIQLKDDELARLQSQAGGEDLDAAEGELVAEEAVASETEVLVDESEMIAEIDPLMDETVLADESVMGDELLPTEDGVSDEVVVDEAVVAEPEPATPVEPPAAIAPPVTVTPPGFVERLLDNPLWLGAGGTVLALLAFFGLRRKRGIETEFQESILQAAQGDSSIADSEIVTTKPDSSPSRSAESSLLSEFAVSDMGSLKGDGEADPLAEADVYLAYGRYQQAEDLIREGLEKDNEREDLNLKLLEVFLAGKNETAFDGHAQVMLAKLEGGTDSPVWMKIAEMGRELSPANPVYQVESEPEADDDQDNIDIDALSQGLEFNLDGEDSGVDESPASESGETASTDDIADEGLDFNIDLSFESVKEDEPSSAEFTPPETTDESTGMSVDMDSVEPDVVSQDGPLDADLENFEMEASDAVDEAESDGELTDLDEVSTKLDLARAYIDMGDPDGAKSILDEVMDEGSEEQKDEARSILGQMA